METPPWIVTSEKVEAAIRRIVEISQPRRVILFGSLVKNQTHAHSDMDVLIVMGDEIKNTREESIRIRRALRGILMPMDILVMTESKLRELSHLPGLIYREALATGKIVYESLQ